MKLEKYLIDNKISQAQFASDMDVSEATVSYWLKGIRLPRFCNLEAIRKLTKGKVKINDFGGGE